VAGTVKEGLAEAQRARFIARAGPFSYTTLSSVGLVGTDTSKSAKLSSGFLHPLAISIHRHHGLDSSASPDGGPEGSNFCRDRTIPFDSQRRSDVAFDAVHQGASSAGRTHDVNVVGASQSFSPQPIYGEAKKGTQRVRWIPM
jgi:hypothetical protein